MNSDIIINLIGGLAGLIAGVVVDLVFSKRAIQIIRRFLKTSTPEETYTQKLSRLTENLTCSSLEVDRVLTELSQVAHNREKAVKKLEMELNKLEGQEKQLKQRINDLENVPIPVAEHFLKLSAAGERRNALRDYMLFGAGVVVSTFITIVLKLIGLG